MTHDELARICAALPIFPLPGSVLLPGQVLPLHVFEPRYRALVSDALERTRVFGIATLMPGYEANYDESPAVFPELGVGRIIRHQSVDGGRSNLLVEGVGRAWVAEELLTDRPYRVVRAELRTDETGGLSVEVARLRMLLAQLGAAAEGPDVEVVDAVARQVLRDPDLRRACLAEDSVAGRARMGIGALAEALARSGPPVGEA